MLKTPSVGAHDFIIDIIKGIQPQEPRWLPCIQKNCINYYNLKHKPRKKGQFKWLKRAKINMIDI
jgi:hypothetical protein